MKSVSLVFLLLLFPVAGVAQSAPACAASPVTGPNASEDLAPLEHFLGLSDTDLDQLAAAIARVRAMTPEQRAALRREVMAFRCLPDNERRDMRECWGAGAPEIQNAWRKMMHQLSPEQRTAIQSKMQTLAPGERAPYRRQLVEEFMKRKSTK